MRYIVTALIQRLMRVKLGTTAEVCKYGTFRVYVLRIAVILVVGYYVLEHGVVISSFYVVSVFSIINEIVKSVFLRVNRCGYFSRFFTSHKS